MAKRRKLAPKPPRARAGAGEARKLASVLGSRDAASRLGVSQRTFQRWVKHGPPPDRRQALSGVVLGPSDVLGQLARHYHQAARSQRRLEAPRDAPGWDRGGKQETSRYRGCVKNVRTSVLVGPRTEETLIRRIRKEAQKLLKKQKRGKFYLTMSLVEYGKEVMGSPGKQLYRQPKTGTAVYQTFEGIRGADSLEGLMVQAEHTLHTLGHTAGSRAVLDSFTVKRYEEKTEGEQEAWRLGDRKRK